MDCSKKPRMNDNSSAHLILQRKVCPHIRKQVEPILSLSILPNSSFFDYPPTNATHILLFAKHATMDGLQVNVLHPQAS